MPRKEPSFEQKFIQWAEGQSKPIDITKEILYIKQIHKTNKKTNT